MRYDDGMSVSFDEGKLRIDFDHQAGYRQLGYRHLVKEPLLDSHVRGGLRRVQQNRVRDAVTEKSRKGKLDRFSSILFPGSKGLKKGMDWYSTASRNLSPLLSNPI